MEKEIAEKYLISKDDMEKYFNNSKVIKKEKLENYYMKKEVNFNAILMQRQRKVIKNEVKRDKIQKMQMS